jgi:hypothetical protein
MTDANRLETATVKDLTPEQRTIMLALCRADDRHPDCEGRVRLVCTTGPIVIRETATGTALVRKGLAIRNLDGTFTATAEGYWLGDALRIEQRLGRIQPRKTRE